MSDHFQAVVDHVMSNDDSELAKTKAELAYALHALEREISICANTRRLLWMVVKANDGFDLEYEELQEYPGDDAIRLTQYDDPITRGVTLRATVAVSTPLEPK